MDKLSTSLEKILIPIAKKINGQKHLVALRDGFITTLVASLVGSMAVMINSVFFLSDSLVGEKLNKIGFWKESIQPAIEKWIINIGLQVQGGTLKIIALLIVFTIAYSLAKSYGVDPLSTAIIACCSYFTLLPDSASGIFKLDNGAYIEVGENLFSSNLFGSASIFAAILTAFVATEIFVRIVNKGWIVKMPELVPPVVAKSFAALIPGSITLFIFGIIAVIFNSGLESSLTVWIADNIQQPLLNFGQSPATYIILILIAQLLWFFGLDGMSILDGILQPLYTPALLENTDLISRGLAPKYALTRNFVDIYAMPGGSGGTIALLIALVLFSKRQESKELAKLAIAPGIFQINQPVIFGLPIVFNAIYFIPFILVSPIMLTLAWLFTEVIPFANYIEIAIPWTTPPIISAFIATNGDVKAAILAAVLLVIAVILWLPFVIIANKVDYIEKTNK